MVVVNHLNHQLMWAGRQIIECVRARLSHTTTGLRSNLKWRCPSSGRFTSGCLAASDRGTLDGIMRMPLTWKLMFVYGCPGNCGAVGRRSHL